MNTPQSTKNGILEVVTQHVKEIIDELDAEVQGTFEDADLDDIIHDIGRMLMQRADSGEIAP